MTTPPASGARSPESARRRLALLIKVASTAGDFSPKLAKAVENATDAEVQVMSDLVEHGMSIPDLVSLLQGAHVVVGNDELYDRWIFPNSRRRLSSHHRSVDKKTHPDYGLDGPLVRESLHGKAVSGTWVQLERTKATFQPGKLPTWSDAVHIRDYVLYRITGKNVGPWGLSAHVDTRPMLLRPPHTTQSRAAGRALSELARRRADVTMSAHQANRWSDVLTPEVAPVGPAGDLFAPPSPEYPQDLLPDAPYKDELGLGLFGRLPIVRAPAALRPGVSAVLDAAPATRLVDDLSGDPEEIALPVRGRTLALSGVVQEMGPVRARFMGIEEDAT